ncbi:aspartate 1-decarboxylase [candidate division WOR-3 bacterium]|nr:aspartate 1-decarboxylase [candidate division WOR-3 bacterium]
MKIQMLKSKIHMARVTDRAKEYDGSITIDRNLAELAGMREFEKVLVADVDTGNRFETYVIYGGEGEVCVNGAAAELVRVGDRVIIMAFGLVEPEEVITPVIIRVDEKNRPL